jgi:spermidine synthase
MTLPRRLPVAIFLIALSTLVLELALTRAFDVILTSQLAYMVITCVMFAFGLAGVYATLRPLSHAVRADHRISVLASLFAGAALVILPALNVLPFDHIQVLKEPIKQILAFLGMYLVLVLPFFISGLIFTTAFSRYAAQVQSLYFWDLVGAGLGCILVIPFIAPIGPGGLVLGAAALALFASALLASSRRWSLLAVGVGVVILIAPFARSPEYFDFREHADKRGVKLDRQAGRVEYTRWDPVSKIDVINPAIDSTKTASSAHQKGIAYDGGSQSSTIYAFDGDFNRLRTALDARRERVTDHFWTRGVLAAHYLKRESRQNVLIIGSAGGQETKAALLYGAARVDAVEMVKAVVDLGTGRYAEHNGGIFKHPNVSVHAGEGRSFLRGTSAVYDIIQIFSNHTSSSIAAGDGAMSPVYLQTAEAYREYFEHLTDDGILHINHHIYPKMITTAALAWKQMGRRDFRRHVVVFEKSEGVDTLPTFLVKMQPWNAAEIDDLRSFFAATGDDDEQFALVENPLVPGESLLSEEFYTGNLSGSLERSIDFRVGPSTDNQPYFNFLRKKWGDVEPSRAKFTSVGTALSLNLSVIKGFIPMDIVHLVITSIVSVIFATSFLLVPLYFSTAGTARWEHKYTSMVYFSCLGLGFIVLELVFIQVFMKLVGFPVYTYSVVIFALLCSAGVGSLSAARLGITPNRRWTWPFAGILVTGVLLALSYSYIFGYFLASPFGVRVAVAVCCVLPVGFFLGMPLPLGILALEKQPPGAIAWAWGLNALFTVVGGLISVILSIFVGFAAALFIALAVYLLAFAVFARLRKATVVAEETIGDPTTTFGVAVTTR